MFESYEEAILARQESEADDCSNCPFNPRLTGESCKSRCLLTLKEQEEMEAESAYKPSPYERAKARVYATGNKWAIENWNATH